MRDEDRRIGAEGIWLFPALALVWLAALLEGGAASAFDRGLLSAFYLGGEARFIGFWVFVTELGGWRALIPLAVAAGAFLLAKRRTRDALFLLSVVIGARVLVEAQKLLVDRARPGEAHLVDVYSQSFPSGHAANSLATYLALAMLFFGSRRAVVAALLLAGLIGLSRVRLGVHWPSDVIGGWAFALLWALALARLFCVAPVRR